MLGELIKTMPLKSGCGCGVWGCLCVCMYGINIYFKVKFQLKYLKVKLFSSSTNRIWCICQEAKQKNQGDVESQMAHKFNNRFIN